MFLLKPENNKGGFVDNLRKTIKTLKHNCRTVPRTAFTSHEKSNKIDTTDTISYLESFQNIVREIELELESNEDIVILEDPIGIVYNS